MEFIPSDILKTIFEYCFDFDNFKITKNPFHLRLVCKRWNDILKSTTLKQFQTLFSIPYFEIVGDNIKQIEFWNKRCEMMKTLRKSKKFWFSDTSKENLRQMIDPADYCTFHDQIMICTLKGTTEDAEELDILGKCKFITLEMKYGNIIDQDGCFEILVDSLSNHIIQLKYQERLIYYFEANLRKNYDHLIWTESADDFIFCFVEIEK